MSNNGTLSILLAEDEDTDVLLLQRAFKAVELSNPLHVVPDGQEAIDFLSQAKNTDEHLPALVILDLKMPRRDGMQVLRWMRGQPIIRCIPAIIFSSSANLSDIESAYDSGANAYLIKPPSLAERAELARFIKEWLRMIQVPLVSAENYKAAQLQRTGSVS